MPLPSSSLPLLDCPMQPCWAVVSASVHAQSQEGQETGLLEGPNRDTYPWPPRSGPPTRPPARRSTAWSLWSHACSVWDVTHPLPQDSVTSIARQKESTSSPPTLAQPCRSDTLQPLGRRPVDLLYLPSHHGYRLENSQHRPEPANIYLCATLPSSACCA